MAILFWYKDAQNQAECPSGCVHPFASVSAWSHMYVFHCAPVRSLNHCFLFWPSVCVWRICGGRYHRRMCVLTWRQRRAFHTMHIEHKRKMQLCLSFWLNFHFSAWKKQYLEDNKKHCNLKTYILSLEILEATNIRVFFSLLHFPCKFHLFRDLFYLLPHLWKRKYRKKIVNLGHFPDPARAFLTWLKSFKFSKFGISWNIDPKRRMKLESGVIVHTWSWLF